MTSKFSVLCVVLGLAIVGSARAQETAEQRAAVILKETGIKGGVVVHLSSGVGSLTAALRANDSFLVQGLDPDAADVAKAREWIRSKGSYGSVSIDRLSVDPVSVDPGSVDPGSVDRLAGTSLPYIDNFVNLVVAEDLLGALAKRSSESCVPTESATSSRTVDGPRSSNRGPKRSTIGRTTFMTRRATRSLMIPSSLRLSGCSGLAARAGRDITIAWPA